MEKDLGALPQRDQGDGRKHAVSISNFASDQSSCAQTMLSSSRTKPKLEVMSALLGMRSSSTTFAFAPDEDEDDNAGVVGAAPRCVRVPCCAPLKWTVCVLGLICHPRCDQEQR